jgi:Flp pilus assembly protein TadG
MIAVEFAAMMPILALILLGVFELSRFMIAIQKVDRIAAAMADYVSQTDKVTQSELTDLFDAVANIASPYSFETGVVIVSSVFKATESGATSVVWQRQGGGGLASASEIGPEDGTAILPGGMTLTANEGMVAAEAMMDYQPLFLDALISPIRIYRVAFYRPRKSQQVALSGG